MRVLGSLVLNFIRAALAIILIASVLLICANAFGRYVLLRPIIWAEEVLGYALVWTVYLGSIIVTAERAHLKMDLLVGALPERAKAVFELIGGIIFLLICGLIIYQAWFSISEFHFKSQVAELPMDVLHLVIPVSFGLIGVALIVNGWQDTLTLVRGTRGDDESEGAAA